MWDVAQQQFHEFMNFLYQQPYVGATLSTMMPMVVAGVILRFARRMVARVLTIVLVGAVIAGLWYAANHYGLLNW